MSTEYHYRLAAYHLVRVVYYDEAEDGTEVERVLTATAQADGSIGDWAIDGDSVREDDVPEDARVRLIERYRRACDDARDDDDPHTWAGLEAYARRVGALLARDP